MVSIEKSIEKFKQNPKTLKFSEIEKIMLNAGFKFKWWWKWSHKKMINPKTNTSYTIPIHSKDCLRVYKEDLLEIYLSNLKQ